MRCCCLPFSSQVTVEEKPLPVVRTFRGDRSQSPASFLPWLTEFMPGRAANIKIDLELKYGDQFYSDRMFIIQTQPSASNRVTDKRSVAKDAGSVSYILKLSKEQTRRL